MNVTVAKNRKAFYEYSIEDRIEAGIALTGTEIKSVRAGRVNLKDGFAWIVNGELFLWNVHISPYDQGNRYNSDPLRKRKLLVHKKEILKLKEKTREHGFTLIPLSIFIKDGKRAKVELAVGKGKKLFDKREAEAERDAKREIARKIKNERI